MGKWINDNAGLAILLAIIFGLGICCLFGVAMWVVGQSSLPMPTKPSPTAYEPIRLEFEGVGNDVQGFTITGIKTMRLYAKCKEDDNFFVRIINRETGRIDRIVNEIGPYEGESSVRFRRDGEYDLEVETEGPWVVVLWR